MIQPITIKEAYTLFIDDYNHSKDKDEYTIEQLISLLKANLEVIKEKSKQFIKGYIYRSNIEKIKINQYLVIPSSGFSDKKDLLYLEEGISGKYQLNKSIILQNRNPSDFTCIGYMTDDNSLARIFVYPTTLPIINIKVLLGLTIQDIEVLINMLQQFDENLNIAGRVVKKDNDLFLVLAIKNKDEGQGYKLYKLSPVTCHPATYTMSFYPETGYYITPEHILQTHIIYANFNNLKIYAPYNAAIKLN